MAKSKHYYIRKTHRWLGVILGVQFLLWTIGGLYFSWSNMDEVHGDFQKKNAPLLSSNISLVSPTMVLDTIKKAHRVDSLISVQLIEILGKPFYQVRCVNALPNETRHQHEMQTMNHLANAETGQLRGPLTKQEAIEMAKMRFNGEPKVKSVEYLATTNGHHEYRESPLPAYAITFEHPSRTTVYVASELGTVQKFRNSKWRIFDFLWMMHTMDYESRDHIGNWLLRVFSIFGLVTVISGFALFFVSAKWNKKRLRNQ
ncbi:MAG TPA: hypothetical protein PKM40_00940 [Bacteroidia bacterium]|nr:hypothetical protein [Bacteroidia bacterium]